MLYTITGRRIVLRDVRAHGNGLYLTRSIDGGMSLVKPKVLVR